ncbi:MAG TPA: hypothetical protein VK158_04225 [Acidobacteriota bacterium]|nr:hypothetical protein [Acidobacteriota bacterium]
MKMKSGQVSIFIVLFLILIAILGITLHLMSERNKDKDKTAQIAQQKEIIQSVKSFLNTCLETSSESAIVDLLAQGGRSAGSTTEFVEYPAAGGTKVGFGIGLRSDALGVPTYLPYTALAQSRPVLPTIFDPSFSEKLKSIGGAVTLTKLCDRWGSNSPTNPKKFLTCELATYGLDKKTIQNVLQDEIFSRTKSCIDAGIASSEAFGNLKYSMTTESNVTFTDDDVRVRQLISAELEAMPITAGFEEIVVIIPVRLKYMYNAMYFILDSDVRDPSFDKLTTASLVTGCNYYGTTTCWKDGFIFNVHKNVDVANAIDVVELIDDKSLINGQPVHFYAAIKNRRPVIDVMGDSGPFAASRVDPSLADYYYKYDATITLRPRVYDFDEDPMTIEYSSWLGDYFDWFSSNCWDEVDTDGDGSVDSYSNFRYYQAGCVKVNQGATPINHWQESDTYKLGTNCVSGPLPVAGMCGSVELPLIDYKEQPYYPEESDVLGLHTVRVKVSDGRGRWDYQDVNIVVGTD